MDSSPVKLLYRFCSDVIHQWGSLVTSGAIIGGIGIWQGAGHPVPPYIYWLIAGVGLFIAFFLAWRKEHIAKELAMAVEKPSALVSFAYEMGDNTACLYVENTGVVAEFFAQLRIPYEQDLHARWSHTNDVRTRIPKGVKRRLILAKLHYSGSGINPFSQWEMFFAIEGQGVGSKNATYSSAVGNPDAQAPDINLQVIIASDPDMAGGVQSRRIVLHSNRAEEV